MRGGVGKSRGCKLICQSVVKPASSQCLGRCRGILTFLTERWFSSQRWGHRRDEKQIFECLKGMGCLKRGIDEEEVVEEV